MGRDINFIFRYIVILSLESYIVIKLLSRDIRYSISGLLYAKNGKLENPYFPQIWILYQYYKK